MKRHFSRGEREVLFLAADGQCARCGVDLERGWHADHVDAYSRGGDTDVVNGQALCPKCNLKKGDKVEPAPRPWQKRFIAKYHGCSDQNFLLVACPGAGKTLAAGFVIKDLLDNGTVERLLIVVPTSALREQWMVALASLGIAIDSITMNNELGEKDTIDGRKCDGWVVTYQSLFSDHGRHKFHRKFNSRKKTMVILDEIHHLGDDASWGKAALDILGPCVKRLGLTGTPFNGSGDTIPFVEFDESGLARYRDPDDGLPYPRGFDYSYGRALQDIPSPVRPVVFDQYPGDAAWLDRWTGDERVADISDPSLSDDDRSQANRHVLDHRGGWLRTVLTDAHDRLTLVRDEGDPTAQGLVLCIDTRRAHEVTKVLEEVAGRNKVATAVSKDENGKDKTEEARETIRTFQKSGKDWLVAVAMVSEGIDIPTWRVEVWATTVRSPLRFRQGMGRIVRRTNLPEDVDQTAYLFVPKDPLMVALANEVYDEVKTALLDQDTPDEYESDMVSRQELLSSESAPFDPFLRAEAGDSSTYVPGFGDVDPAQVSRLVQESGQSFGAVAAVVAAMAKLGDPSPHAESTEKSTSTPNSESLDTYPLRLKMAKGQFDGLTKQFTDAYLKKKGLPRDQFGEKISRLKRRACDKAGIEKGQYERADLPQINEAIRIVKKMWAESE